MYDPVTTLFVYDWNRFITLKDVEWREILIRWAQGVKGNLFSLDRKGDLIRKHVIHIEIVNTYCLQVKYSSRSDFDKTY